MITTPPRGPGRRQRTLARRQLRHRPSITTNQLNNGRTEPASAEFWSASGSPGQVRRLVHTGQLIREVAFGRAGRG